MKSRMRTIRDSLFLRRASKATWLGLVAGLTISTVGQVLADDVWSQMERIAAEERTKNGMPSVSVAVVKAGEIIWTKNLGYADLEHRKVATSDTVYGIGSLSKVFAGAALMYVRDQGKLAIDDPVRRFVELQVSSRFPDTPPLTFRMLANHT